MHRKQAPHPTPIITSRLCSQGQGTVLSLGGHISEARREGRGGQPGGEEGGLMQPSTASSLHVTTATRTPCACCWGSVYS